LKPSAFISAICVLLAASPALAGGDGGHEAVEVPYTMVIPFVLMLLSIAIFPLVREHWWEKNSNKLLVSAVLGIPMLGYLFFRALAGSEAERHFFLHKVEHAIVFDYVPFIILLGSLFVISGGIMLRGDLRATPKVNTAFLAVGAVLASFIGTTGAAMLLIRPVLATNSQRKHTVHTVIFFIFIVANIGGCLTPLGDPPLFLGYLRGVPFAWTFNLVWEWMIMNAVLLSLYFAWDTFAYRREDKEALAADDAEVEPLSIHGGLNFLWLGGIVASVALINANYIPVIAHNPWLGFLREAAMLSMVGLSILTTRKGLRKENKFTMHPIIEVAFLFIGIFVTMIPALILLETHGKDLGLTEPWHFFWSTGVLSSFLDNAPTYVTFFTTATGFNMEQAAALAGQAAPEGMMWVGQNLIDERTLIAISLGAVFMGAMTYIGNGPNFMVKAVAEEAGIKMPSFFGYMLYSCLILLPLLVLITLVFIV
jgi:Na+/H+ antiporter NhaD/arsenite permease-like protein